jgi:hypothetical protein
MWAAGTTIFFTTILIQTSLNGSPGPLSDISGRLLSNGSGTGTIIIPTEHLPSGVYLIRVTGIISGNSICQKVIVE